MTEHTHGDCLPLDDSCLATLLFTARWRSPGATHEERYLARRVNFWRDILPASMEAGARGLRPGERAVFTLGGGEGLPAYDPALARAIGRNQFVGVSPSGRVIAPRPGRYYPKGLLRGVPGLFPSNMQPFKVIALHDDSLEVDLNHPLAGRDVTLELRVENTAAKQCETGGRLTDWMEEFLGSGPGLQAHDPAAPADFTDDDAMRRLDEGEDSVFYERPRMVGHVDAQASAFLQAEYGARLPKGARVLDLMSSLQSHLPDDKGYAVTGLGLNAEELAANPVLAERTVLDLNAEPRLPYNDASFDAVVCSLSIEYLTQPRRVLAEAARVLAPEGRCLVAFSNRWFPTKATRQWMDLHEFERMGLVLDYLADAGFNDLATLSIRNWWRPVDDPHIKETWVSDPVYLVTASRS